MHPCCNESLQWGAKIIAVVELVIAICRLSLSGVLVFYIGGAQNSPKDKEDATTDAYLRILTTVVIVFGALYILVAVLLLVGAIKRNRTLCMVWFVLSVIFVILEVLGILRDFTSGDKHSVFYTFLWTLLQSYFLWVVWAFMAELKEEAAVSPYTYPMLRV